MNLISEVDKLRYDYRGLFNNIVISKLAADETIETMKKLSASYPSKQVDTSDGTIFGIALHIDKYLPDNILLLRQDENIVDIINLRME